MLMRMAQTDHQSDEPEQALNLIDLRAKHKRAAQLAVAGCQDTEISTLLGITTATVKRMRSNPVFLAYCEKLQARQEEEVINIREEIEALAPAAVKRLELLLNHADPKVGLAVAQDVLDRAGYSKVNKYQGVQVNLGIPTEEVDKIRSQVADLKRLGIVVGSCSGD